MSKPIMELNDELGVLLGDRKLRTLEVKDEDVGFDVDIWYSGKIEESNALDPRDYQDKHYP